MMAEITRTIAHHHASRVRRLRSGLVGKSLLLAGLLLFASMSATSAAPPQAGIEFFEKKIRPLLSEHCYSCHSTQAKKQKGGLLLDTRDGLRKGGESGPALVPGKPGESLLLKAVGYTDESLKMPPKSKLSDNAIADLAEWIKMGAPDPRDKAIVQKTAPTWEEILASRRTWWSLQPVRKVEPPAVKDAAWSSHAVDRFLLNRLEQVGLAPAAAADPRTLVRRLHLILTGLPPSPEVIERFVQSAICNLQSAIEQEVDRLLASPHFGERWARHWLDVVRFTETHGNEWNYEVHHAWRYRDYLIRAFNDDVPFDQFVREHLAGDMLPPRWNVKERFNEAPIGTAFFRFGEVNHDDCIEFRQLGFDLLDNQIDTLGKAFQGTTIACARCHDHKIDSVSMKDYYGLLGILRGSRLVSHGLDDPTTNAQKIQELRQRKGEIRSELAKIWTAEVRDVGKKLLAQVAAKPEKTALEDPLHPLAVMRMEGKDAVAWKAAWERLAGQYEKESRERAAFNAAAGFVPFTDFRSGSFGPWQADGQGAQHSSGPCGDFAIAGDGDAAVSGVLPRGLFTHRQSERLHGALRSPVLPANKKHISLQVLGGRFAAVRLVSNNCQLNYKNFRYLKSSELGWATFAIPEDAAELRVYAELMTKFNNPKWPDQLGTLSAGEANQRVPWEEAAVDPRSFFGVTRVVLHDSPEPPKDELTHLRPLVGNSPPRDEADLAARYAAIAEAAVRAWAEDRATDDDARWLGWLLKRGLLANARKATPRLEALVEQFRASEKELALPRIAPGVGESGTGYDQPVFVRGDCRKPGEVVPRHYLEVLNRSKGPFVLQGSGRRELANAIASPDNPLTARVYVNRVWHHLFGAGLVRTTDDFGRMGDPPSHPELLDYLARRFTEDGWSTRRLIRALVLTRAFQMTSRPSRKALEVDPQNRLLHHYPAHRLEAEAIRDAILATSGRLDRALYGPSIQPYRVGTNEDRRLFPGPLDGAGRRSVYIRANLMESPRFLGVFDLPGGKVAQGRRDVTNVPAQALALLNDPFVLQQAGVWADRLVAAPDATVAARLERMFHTALGRPPARKERERLEQAVVQLAALHGVAAEGVLKSPAVWKDVAHAFFNMKEFIFIR